MTARVAALLLSSALVAACLPNRGNELDPANAPRARISVVDLGADCEFPGSTAFGQISRGHCLGLDATATTDPQDDSAEYRFVLPQIEDPVLSESGQIELDGAYRRMLSTTGAAVTFAVRVFDRVGNYDDEEVSILFSNEPPTAVIDRGFSIRVGGSPGSGIPIPVTFDASASSDPDGDPLSYCWSIDAIANGDEVCTPESTYTIDAPLEEGRYIARLVVRDAEEGANSAESRMAFETLWVEPPGLWETQANGSASPITRIDVSSFASLTPNGGSAVFYDSPVLGRAVATLFGIDPEQLQLFSYPDFTPATPMPVNTGGRVRTHSDSDLLWHIGPGSSAYAVDSYRIQLDLSLAPLTVGSVVLTFPGGSANSVQAVAGPQGRLWMAATHAPLLQSVDEQGSVQPEAIDLVPMDLAMRPGREELWVMVQEADSATFRIYTASGQPAQNLPLSGLEAYGFEFIDESEMWITTVDGVRRIDVEELLVLAGIPEAVELATNAIADVLVPSGLLVTDAATGEVWAAGTRIAPDLSVHAGGQGTPMFVDPDGYTWVSSGGPHRARTSSTDRTLENITLAEGASLASIDLVRSSAWVVTNTPRAILEVTFDGRRERRIAALEMPGVGVVPVPLFEDLVIDPDANGMWALDDGPTSNVYHLDFEESPIAATTIATFDNVTETLYTFAGFAPSVNAAPPYVWTAAYSPTLLYPVRVGMDGTIHRETGITISSQLGYQLGIARSIVDDGACIATFQEIFQGGSTFQLNVALYRAVPGSAAVLVDSEVFSYTGSGPGSFDYKFPFVSASRAPDGGEMCWTGYVRRANPPTNTSVEVLTVFGAQQGTGRIRSFSYAGLAGEVIESVAATGPDEVWYLRDTKLSNGNPTSSIRVRRSGPNGSGVLVDEQTYVSFDHVGEPRNLLSAETQSF